jgi:predicted ATPase
MQRAVLFRLAVEGGAVVSYRALSEDIWSRDAPENSKAALQSIVSRLRTQLPERAIESAPGGYRLVIDREAVDALRFTDLVAAATAASAEPDTAAALAREALNLWLGAPWVPDETFDWFERDLASDRAEALRIAGSMPTRTPRPHIPVPLTALVGRGRELEALDAQLSRNRLVTILGTGGTGKTRLAAEAGRARGDVVLVELAPAGPADVIAAILGAVGREIRTTEAADGMPPRERIVDALAGRDVLLILDNTEHLTESAAAIAVDLLGVLPRLRILATSREPLGVPGEAFLPLGPLVFPHDVELFAERAEAALARPLDADELQGAAQICTRLDGLPLAIELAAARVRTMSIDEILRGLDDRFTLLARGRRSDLPRHQTLRGMIDWSWSLLDEDERTALLALSVAPAGIAAEDLAARVREFGPVTAMESLVERCLVQRVGGRFRALETIREYGVERLADRGELEPARTRQAQWIHDQARAHDALIRGPHLLEALDWFDAEEDNLLGALRWATGVGAPELVVGLVGSSVWYWTIRDRLAEFGEWLTLAVPHAVALPGDDAALVRIIGAIVGAFSGTSTPESGPSEEEARAVLAVLDEVTVDPQSHDLIQVANVLVRSLAAAIGDEAWMTRVRLPDPADLPLGSWARAAITVFRASMAQNRGDIDELGRESERAVALFAEQGDRWGLALAMQMRSEWLAVHGRLAEALELSISSTERLRPVTSSWDLTHQRSLAVSLLLRLGRTDEAREALRGITEEAEASGHLGAIAQAAATGLVVALELDDLATARERAARFDAVATELPRVHEQLAALVAVGRAGILLLEGDPERATAALTDAATHALASHDHPVIGTVALEIGRHALAAGDLARAARALHMADRAIGVRDETDPRVRAIVQALEATAGWETLSHPAGTDSLRELLR